MTSFCSLLKQRARKSFANCFAVVANLKASSRIIVRSLKRVTDGLRQSASVSRLTCFHFGINDVPSYVLEDFYIHPSGLFFKYVVFNSIFLGLDPLE